MTAAIFGLIGVVVGGLLNLAVAAWHENRRDRLRVRPVARLVMGELRDWQGLLHAAERRGSDYGLPAPKAWPAGAEVLAPVVDGKTWVALDYAYATAHYLYMSEGDLPLRAAMEGPYAISDAIRVAQQQLMHYADMPNGQRIAESLERPRDSEAPSRADIRPQCGPSAGCVARRRQVARSPALRALA